MKDNSNPPSLFDCLDMFAHQKEEMCNVPRADEPVPEWALRGLDAKGRNLLKLLCPEFLVGDVAGLTRENLSGRRGYGKSSVDAVMALVDACRDGSVWTPRGIFVVHANEFDSLSDMILKTVEEAFPLNDACRMVMRVYLGLLDATERATLEETGKIMHVTRERVRQIGKKILDALNTTPLTVGLSDFMDWAKSFFGAHGMEASESEFVDAVAMEFSWAKPTPFSLRRVLDELGFKTEVNPLTGLVAWNKDGVYDWVKTYKSPTVTEQRRTAIKAVLQEAGPGGLTIEEILVACKAKFPDVDIGAGNINGCKNLGNDLDDCGTRMIGLERGKKGSGGTRYTLNTFFHDDDTKSVLQKAGEEVKEYIEKTGFGVVDVWKIWCKYKGQLHYEKPLPKLGFYMMMRDIEAGGLCYKDYPRISYKWMDVCENAYWWELYEYFLYCGHPKASFSQIMSFFVDCLGIQPDIAVSCAFNSMGLEKEEDITTAHYVMRRPPTPKDAPVMLLETTKKDEELSLIKADGKFTIHSDYFDEDGHAIRHPTYVKVFLRELEKNAVGFCDEEISQLADAGWCKVHLKIPRPMLKRVCAVKQEKGRGYWLEEFKFGDANYYACCDWHQANKSAFDAWAVKKAKDAGIVFEPYEIGAGDVGDIEEECGEELPGEMSGNDVKDEKVSEESKWGEIIPRHHELQMLNDRERQIVDFRLGISDGCKRSVEEVAKLFCMPREQITKIENKAFRKIEHARKEVVAAIKAFEGEHWAMGMVLAEKTDLTDARLQYYMGYCYENGFGTAKDIDAAKEWYEKAATQGNEDAIKRLEKKSNNDEDADDDEDGELTEEDKRILEQIGKERIDAALRKILEEWSEQTTHKHSRLAADIKSGKIKSKSGEGYFVLKGEFFDAIKAGRKTTEYRDLTPRNLSKSIGIKTVKLQRGYGHPGQPPEQMRFEVKSVGLLDADDRECDPYNIPDGFIATTIAIHLGKRIG